MAVLMGLAVYNVRFVLQRIRRRSLAGRQDRLIEYFGIREKALITIGISRKKEEHIIRYATILLLVFSLCSTAFAETYVVRAGKANIRHGPGTGFPVAWQVEKGYVYEKVKQEGDWIQVRDMDGDGGWVMSTLLRKKPVVVVASEIANVRKEPRTDSPIVFKAQHGVVLNYLDRKGDWLKVSYTGQGTGWIFSNLVWGNP